MPSSGPRTPVLLWLMFFIGGGTLLACLFLPPWLELRALRRTHATAEQRISGLEDHLARVSRQIEHLRNDPAYLERLSRKEFGTDTPGVEMIWMETLEQAASQPASAPAVAAADRREGLAAALERAAQGNPFVSVFVLDQTRPIVMAMSGVLIVGALVLLYRSRVSDRADDRRPEP